MIITKKYLEINNEAVSEKEKLFSDEGISFHRVVIKIPVSNAAVKPVRITGIRVFSFLMNSFSPEESSLYEKIKKNKAVIPKPKRIMNANPVKGAPKTVNKPDRPIIEQNREIIILLFFAKNTAKPAEQIVIKAKI